VAFATIVDIPDVLKLQVAVIFDTSVVRRTGLQKFQAVGFSLRKGNFWLKSTTSVVIFKSLGNEPRRKHCQAWPAVKMTEDIKRTWPINQVRTALKGWMSIFYHIC
jgi:hypothetical protein